MNLLCPKCGKRIQDGAKFCDGCGMRISHINGSRMNICQRRILIAVAIALPLMLLFPPFREVGIANVAGGRNPGSHYYYGWLPSNVWGSVEVGLLFAQFFVVGVVAAIAYVLCADKKQ